MPEFVKAPDGVRIAYETVGSGPAVMLVHGFAASRVQNWKAPGWYETLTGAGYRVVAMDCRGHGDSDKPHDPAAYGGDVLVDDIVGLMDHLDLGRADLDPVRVAVDAKLGDLDHDGLLRVAAPQHRVHAQHELADAEGLHQVVVGAELEADDAIHDNAAGGEHQDRRCIGSAEFAQNVEAADGGQHHIQYQ